MRANCRTPSIKPTPPARSLLNMSTRSARSSSGGWNPSTQDMLADQSVLYCEPFAGRLLSKESVILHRMIHTRLYLLVEATSIASWAPCALHLPT